MKISTGCLSYVCVASLAFSWAATAQEKISVRPVVGNAADAKAAPAAPSVTPVQDNSKGFEMFYKFGLPDISKAKYVRLEAYGPSFYSGRGMEGLYELKLQGNAWMVQENRESNSTFIVDLSRVEQVWDRKVLEKQQEEARKKKEAEDKAKGTKPAGRHYPAGYDPDDTRIGGKWTEVDPAKDAQVILAYLEKLQGKDRKNDWALRNGGYGKLFLMAIHFYKAGLKDQANKIVSMLFDVSQDRRKVIVGALNELADSQLKVVHDTFFRSSDWAAYGRDLDALLARYTSGWEQAPAIKMLVTKVKDRAAQEKAPAIEEAGLTDEDKALAAELAAPPDKDKDQHMRRYGMYGYHGRYSSGGLWILGYGKSLPKPAGNKEETAEDPIAKIRKRGIKSVPLLLALLKDDYLLAQDSNNGGYSRTYYDSDGGMTAERVQQMYRQMRRPLSRGDIAESLLTGLAIESGKHDYRNEGDREELGEQMRQWYEENKDKKPVELARLYFEKGDNSQKRMALDWLLRNGEESDAQAIEKHFLESENALQDNWTVRNYVMKRGEKAREFVDKYEQAMKKEMETDKDGMFKNEKSRKSMEAAISSLKELLTIRPSADILADLLSGKAKMAKVREALARSLSREKPEKIILLMLENAGKATNVNLAADLIGYTSQARYMRYNYNGMDWASDEDGQIAEEESADMKPDPVKHAALWKKFLDDNREVRGSTLSEIAAGTIESLYGLPDEYRQNNGEAYKLGDRIKKIVRERALARLEGKGADALPKYPSSDNVSDEARKTLADRIVNARAEDLSGILKGFTLDELLALALVAEDNEELSKKVFPVIRNVETVAVKAEKAEAFRVLESAKGKPADKKLIETVVDLCKKAAQGGKGVNVMLVREACLGGFTLTVRDSSGQSGMYQMMGRRPMRTAQLKASVKAQVSAAETQISTMWEVEESKTDSKPASKPAKNDDLLADVLEDLDVEIATKSEESRVEFWKGVDEFCAGTGNAFDSSWISVTAVPKVEPKEKKAGTAEEEEEGEEEFGIPDMGMDMMF